MSDRILVMNHGAVEQTGTPKEIYHRPQSSFVADFIGGANIMEAEVMGEMGPDLWTLATPIGELVAQCDRAPVAKRLRVCWRPENAQRKANGANLVTADITHRSFQGSFTDLFFERGGREYRLQLAETADEPIGETVRFLLRPGDIVMLEPVP